MARVVLGLGSNLGDRAGYLAAAIATLRLEAPDLAVSPTYETAPVGGPDGQGQYLNCVVIFESSRSPEELLVLAHELEAAAGRVRAERWGARTLDVDVLLVGDAVRDEAVLTVPHPRMSERAFVLAPLEDLDPRLVPPHWRERLGGADAVAAAVRRVQGPDVVGDAP